MDSICLGRPFSMEQPNEALLLPKEEPISMDESFELPLCTLSVDCSGFECSNALIEAYSCPQCEFVTHQLVDLFQHNKLGLHYNRTEHKTEGDCLQNRYSIREDGKTKWYHCRQCPYTSKKYSNLKRHFACKHCCQPDQMEQWFECLQCGQFETREKYLLRQHCETAHNNAVKTEDAVDASKMFSCELCDFRTNRKDTIKKHMYNMHADPEQVEWFQCDECDYKTKYKTHFGIHKKTCHGDADSINWFECTVCPYRAKSRSNLNRHLTSVHNLQIIAAPVEPKHVHCETAHNNAVKVEDAVDASKVFGCELCDFRTNRKDTIKKHMYNMHADPEQVEWFHCDECDYKTKYKTHFGIHKKTCHGDADAINWFECTVCPYRAKSRSNLNRHLTSVHKLPIIAAPVEPKQEAWQLCDKCAYQTRFKSMLKRHIYTTHTESDQIHWFECDLCEFKTKTSNYLKQHKAKKHTEPTGMETKAEKSESDVPKKQRPVDKTCKFLCEYCSYTTNSKAYLKHHINNVHLAPPEREKVYKCAQCDFRTAWKATVKLHTYMRHTSDDQVKWYHCEQCDFKTKTKRTVSLHVKNKHSEFRDRIINLYRCDQCPYKTQWKGRLKEHKVALHDEPAEWLHCPECHYQTKLRMCLKSHMLYKHTDDDKVRWFDCEHCVYRTKFKQKLRMHVKAKHTDKPAVAKKKQKRRRRRKKRDEAIDTDLDCVT